ncbi:MAG: CCA tRNA nucleotidyltransferase [Rhodospirillales bacterium]|nr:CCA tRNA nucleotidyltransferase [Rhodospirillales bacterium]
MAAAVPWGVGAGGADGGASTPPQPVGRIHPQPWMTAPETVAVLEALAADGAEVRFIGGCVRDSLLKRPVRDIDIALAVPPTGVMALLRRAGIKAIPTGIDHGTITAVVGAQCFEITTLRVDVETFGRRARVAFTDDWIADAARRDFTFNALSCTVDGEVYDFFGGLEDLGHGRVRFVGDASERIGEDVLRLLRYFRFYAHYGRPPPDVAALAACRAYAEKLPMLSGERVRVEIFRTLMATDPADVFALMRAQDVLAHVLPEANGIERLKMLSWIDSRAVRIDSVAPDPVRRLAALLTTDADGAGLIAERLKLSNRQRDRLVALAAGPPVHPELLALAVVRLLRSLGRETVRDLALLGWAGELAQTARLTRGRNTRWIELLHGIDQWQPVVFPLMGRDALALGIPRGPRIGALLRQVEDWWEEGGYAADRTACLAQLRLLAGAAGRPR